MKDFAKYLFLCLVFLLPYVTHAQFTGEIIFKYHGNDWNELWITHIENAKNTRLLYKHNEKEFIDGYSVQKDSPIIAIAAGGNPTDIFLINRNQLGAEPRDITKKRFKYIRRVRISPNGDILFSNPHIAPLPGVIVGLYLMPSDEIKKATPQATLLKEGSPGHFDWSPDSERFIYLDSADSGLFLYNLLTDEDTLITKDKLSIPNYPAFSPDGKTLAFMYQPILEPGLDLDVISLESLHPQLFTIDLERYRFFGLKWPAEKYLVYGIKDLQTGIRRHYVIRIDRGPPEQILEGIEDMFEKGLSGYIFGNTTFAVEPTNRLTAVWGKIKTGSLK